MRAALLAFLFVATPCWAQAKVVVPFKAEVLDTGVYEVTGQELRLIQAGTQLKAVQGTTFGFRYRLHALPDGPIPGLELKALHPAMRGPDGRVSRTSTVGTEISASGGEARGDVAYTLSEPFEVLRGDWELQLLYLGSVILSKQFKLQ